MMIPACFIYLKPNFSPTCLLCTPSRTVCGKSPSCHPNWFPTWYQRCTGSRVSRNYSRCDTEKAALELGQLLCQHVGQPYSPRSIHHSHRDPPNLLPPSLERQLLQASDGPTWEIIGLSGMGGDCNVPPPEWSARPQKTSQLPSTHRVWQAPNAANQDLQAWESPRTTREGYSPGDCALHCWHGSNLLRPQRPLHCLPGNHWILLLPQFLRIHEVHWTLLDYPITSPHRLHVLCRGLSPDTMWHKQSFYWDVPTIGT